MRGDYTNGFLAHFGLKCSTWTSVNAGTSSRSACSSVGNCNHPSVREGNCLGSRSFVSIASKLYTQLCSTLPPTESYFFLVRCYPLEKGNKSSYVYAFHCISKDDTLDDGGGVSQWMHYPGTTLFQLLWVLSPFQGAGMLASKMGRSRCSFLTKELDP